MALEVCRQQIPFKPKVVQAHPVGPGIFDGEEHRSLLDDGARHTIRKGNIPRNGRTSRQEWSIDECIRAGAGHLFHDNDVKRPEQEEKTNTQAQIPQARTLSQSMVNFLGNSNN
ncbi:hypothetical protein ACSQ76_05860 [Roseovarius sp. B08]|uniref:hypothetical protein n=1 Tax=Roseovarius sp. B08 TaxID=3449223 RepID=UPI003EDC4A50